VVVGGFSEPDPRAESPSETAPTGFSALRDDCPEAYNTRLTTDNHPARSETIDTQEKLELVKTILDEKKANEIDVIDVTSRTLLADYFVICSGTSNTHIKAITDGLIVDGKARGLRKEHVEGYKEARWVLVDYGDIVVHVFAAEERGFYDIESLWKETAVKLKSAAK